MKVNINKTNIAIMIARKGYDIDNLALKYGVNRGNMYKIINSEAVTTKCLGRLAKSLECDPEELVYKNDYKKDKGK